jgi:hypothetical protein
MLDSLPALTRAEDAEGDQPPKSRVARAGDIRIPRLDGMALRLPPDRSRSLT